MTRGCCQKDILSGADVEFILIEVKWAVHEFLKMRVKWVSPSFSVIQDCSLPPSAHSVPTVFTNF